MLLEHVQDSGHHLLMMFNHVGVQQDVVHVDCHVAFINEVLENVIHHHLEGGQAIGETEEHDKGFEEALICSEGSFPLITLLNSYIAVSQCMSNFVKCLAFESEL